MWRKDYIDILALFLALSLGISSCHVEAAFSSSSLKSFASPRRVPQSTTSTSASNESSLPLLRRARSIIPPQLPFSLPWYENGLEFSCTGCSKCCKVDGDVWLAPEDVTNIVQFLGQGSNDDSNNNRENRNGDEKDTGVVGNDTNDFLESSSIISNIKDFRKTYIRAEITPSDQHGNPDFSQSWMCLKRTEEGACIFLDPSGKCGIYDARPIQCHTYPFWPSLLEDQDVWMEEAVLPDDVTLPTAAMVATEEGEGDGNQGILNRHWSPELGGCEGISIGNLIDSVAEVARTVDEKDDLRNAVDLEKLIADQQDAVIVGRKEIQAKRREAKRHWRRFPGEEIKQTSWYL